MRPDAGAPARKLGKTARANLQSPFRDGLAELLTWTLESCLVSMVYSILLLVPRSSREKVLRSLRAVHRRRQALLRELMRTDPLIVGTVCEVLRRCGTPSCHCARTPGHRQTLLLYGKAGRRTSKFIRQEDVERVRRAWCRYRSSKKALREIRALNNREIELLRAQIQARSMDYE